MKIERKSMKTKKTKLNRKHKQIMNVIKKNIKTTKINEHQWKSMKHNEIHLNTIRNNKNNKKNEKSKTIKNNKNNKRKCKIKNNKKQWKQ